MRGTLKAADPYTFTRAAWDEQNDAELEYDGHMSYRLQDTARKGVYELWVGMWPLERPPSDPAAVSWTGEWPNSQQQAFEAFLYSAVHRVARMFEEWRTTEERQRAGKGNTR